MSATPEPAALVHVTNLALGEAVAMALLDHPGRVALSGPAADEILRTINSDQPDLADRVGVVDAQVEEGSDPIDAWRAMGATAAGLLGHIDLFVCEIDTGAQDAWDLLTATGESVDPSWNTGVKAPFFLTQGVAQSWRVNPNPPSEVSTSRRSKLVYVAAQGHPWGPPPFRDTGVISAAVAALTRLWAIRLAPLGTDVYELRWASAGENGPTAPSDLPPAKRVAEAIVAIAEERISYATGNVLTVR
jgi:NAD(P)-dependent dehydrogenase (short-subunit alcohol dehydrogenase family)